jgi:hypothetical protein
MGPTRLSSRYSHNSLPAVNYAEGRFPCRKCFAKVFVIALDSWAILQASGVRSEPKSVLVLYGERAELPAMIAVHGGLETALRDSKQIDVFFEFPDFSRFPEPAQREELHSPHPQLQQKAKPFKWTYAETNRRIRTNKKSL